jgi:hypothetical protein
MTPAGFRRASSKSDSGLMHFTSAWASTSNSTHESDPDNGSPDLSV